MFRKENWNSNHERPKLWDSLKSCCLSYRQQTVQSLTRKDKTSLSPTNPDANSRIQVTPQLHIASTPSRTQWSVGRADFSTNQSKPSPTNYLKQNAASLLSILKHPVHTNNHSILRVCILALSLLWGCHVYSVWPTLFNRTRVSLKMFKLWLVILRPLIKCLLVKTLRSGSSLFLMKLADVQWDFQNLSNPMIQLWVTTLLS